MRTSHRFRLYSFPANTVFKTSGEFTNLQNLPFAATFNGATMVAGQHIAVFSHLKPR